MDDRKQMMMSRKKYPKAEINQKLQEPEERNSRFGVGLLHRPLRHCLQHSPLLTRLSMYSYFSSLWLHRFNRCFRHRLSSLSKYPNESDTWIKPLCSIQYISTSKERNGWYFIREVMDDTPDRTIGHVAACAQYLLAHMLCVPFYHPQTVQYCMGKERNDEQ